MVINWGHNKGKIYNGFVSELLIQQPTNYWDSSGEKGNARNKHMGI